MRDRISGSNWLSLGSASVKTNRRDSFIPSVRPFFIACKDGSAQPTPGVALTFNSFNVLLNKVIFAVFVTLSTSDKTEH